MNPRCRAISISGTHSCAEPRAVMKEFLRSGLVNRPFPSAKVVAIESAALELINQKIVAPRKSFSPGSYTVRKIYGLLIDLKILEHKGHG